MNAIWRVLLGKAKQHTFNANKIRHFMLIWYNEIYNNVSAVKHVEECFLFFIIIINCF